MQSRAIDLWLKFVIISISEAHAKFQLIMNITSYLSLVLLVFWVWLLTSRLLISRQFFCELFWALETVGFPFAYFFWDNYLLDFGIKLMFLLWVWSLFAVELMTKKLCKPGSISNVTLHALHKSMSDPFAERRLKRPFLCYCCCCNFFFRNWHSALCCPWLKVFKVCNNCECRKSKSLLLLAPFFGGFSLAVIVLLVLFVALL